MSSSSSTSSGQTLIHKLRDIHNRKPDAEAFISYSGAGIRQAITFKEFYTLCKRFAHVLKTDLGVKAGDYVCTTLPVSIETAVATFGIAVAGAIPVSLDITFRHGEAILQCLEKLDSRLKLILIRDQEDDNVRTFFKDGLTFPEKKHGGGTSSGGGAGCDTAQLSWARLPHLKKAYLVKRGGGAQNDFLAKLRNAKGEFENDQITGKNSGIMHYTTGTVTNYLKMTELTHATIVTYCHSYYTKVFIKPYTKFLFINGWYWTSGVPFDIINGVTRCIPDNWSVISDMPKYLYRFIRSEGIEFADLPPVYLEGIVDLWKADAAKDSHSLPTPSRGSGGNGGKVKVMSKVTGTGRPPLLDLLTIIGMPITRRMLQRYQCLTNTFNLIYGSHECGANHSHILSASEADTFTDFDCGHPMPGVESKVVDEDGLPVPLGEKGRLLLKTPGMFVGYPNEPERTAACFNADGWFVTRDRALYHKDTKRLMVGGRIDSIILHGEFMIYPTWIEEMVAPHPAVKEIVCVPVADDVLFHAVGVCVIKHRGKQLTKGDVTRRLHQYLFPDKVFIFDIKHLLFVDEYPRLPDGQVDRSAVFDLVNERVKAQQ